MRQLQRIGPCSGRIAIQQTPEWPLLLRIPQGPGDFPFSISSFHRPATEFREQALPTGPCRMHRLIAMNDGLEFVQDRPVPPAALYFFPHDGKGLFRGKGLAVGPVCSKRVINVGDLEDPCRERNLCALQPVRVPGAVLLFMMVTNDRQHMAEGSEWGADSLTYHGVLLHDFSLFRSQWSGFEQDVLRHGQLADIVYKAASAQCDAQFLR